MVTTLSTARRQIDFSTNLSPEAAPHGVQELAFLDGYLPLKIVDQQ
ncbi:hypothetical protein [Nocardia sp. NPDC003345]